jgi:hypothetical protein
MRRCAYVSIRQHTSGTSLVYEALSDLEECDQVLVYEALSCAHVCAADHTSGKRFSGYVSIREHTLEHDADELNAPTATQHRHTGVNAYLRTYEAHALFVFRCSRQRLQQRRRMLTYADVC